MNLDLFFGVQCIIIDIHGIINIFKASNLNDKLSPHDQVLQCSYFIMYLLSIEQPIINCKSHLISLYDLSCRQKTTISSFSISKSSDPIIIQIYISFSIRYHHHSLFYCFIHSKNRILSKIHIITRILFLSLLLIGSFSIFSRHKLH